MSRRKYKIKPAPAGGVNSPWRHLPNGISLFRVILIPVMFWLSLSGHNLMALIVFCVAALSDLLDGWLAHRFHWHTHFGSLLDPVADRLFILCLIPLLWSYGSISGVYTTLVIVRFSIQLSVVPVLFWWLKKEVMIAPGLLSKAAMALAFLVLGMGFAEQVAIEYFPETSGAEKIFEQTLDALTLLGALLEIWVLVRFVPRYWHIIRGEKDLLE
ncbi:CDP-alcohol phosphatidyltransferase family protein [Microbulbifer sp. YPW1]|uniref:CDP-alcohol phosphatidyltransferase family protein n=1 Tax=Microbulbifer sp. YPW1 TaxID=2745199 RepID=UPI001597544A|nr:CDP-alcohol phosphatidyltransferase family protein [Microbulbifer sp. YPW1]QKX16657.1 CDP-alcohol phosphatidyltransferase family protein [Microbulbifer sp. YPW1]